MNEPVDNHFTRRADDRQAQGYKDVPAYPALILLILCWCLVVCLFTLLGLPFVQFLIEHGRVP